MDFDDLEKKLSEGSFSLSQQKSLEHLTYLTIENHSMLKVLLESQAKIHSILDPSKTKEEYRETLSKLVNDINLVTFTALMNNSLDK